jgi:hypothetical protein
MRIFLLSLYVIISSDLAFSMIQIAIDTSISSDSVDRKHIVKTTIKVNPVEATDATITLIQKSIVESLPGIYSNSYLTIPDTIGTWKAPLQLFLAEGDYTVIAKKEGYKETIKSVAIRKNANNDISIDIFSFAYIQNKKDTWKKNTIYFELLGNGGVYSVNYDRLLSPSMSLRFGVSYLPTGNDISTITIPIMFNFLAGGGNSKFEVGVGIMVFSVNNWFLSLPHGSPSSGVALTGFVGYRYQSNSSGSFYRIGVTPFYGYRNFIPTIGLSGGFSF